LAYTSALQRALFFLTVALVIPTSVDKQTKIADDSIIQVLSLLFSCWLFPLSVTMRGQRAVENSFTGKNGQQTNMEQILCGKDNSSVSLVKEFPHIVVPESSLLYSQELTTRLCPEQAQSSSQRPTSFL
jgi:hypothetical protein